MKKLLLLSALLIFACSSDDSTSDDNNDNNNNTPFICDVVPYESIVYGTQEWTIENACQTTYRDGTPIPEVTDNAEWESLTTGAWCYYNNDPTRPRLYNWYAVMGIHDTDNNTPNKEFAPEGWHIPTNDEWITLENYLITNSYNYDGTTSGNKIAKAMASTTGWCISNNVGVPGNDLSLNNNSGFNAVPEGYRFFNRQDNTECGHAIFWSSSSANPNKAWSHGMYTGSVTFKGDYYTGYKQNGNSVRFVRD
ncbi:MAG: fibrobacter succinogenes major paralogous domain-containing protein [Flavobacteriaceae bacterium]|nr:fibrobacter succinogenes major paralogous domain-containing protein [Flavobacteriaceae bacterium]